MRGQNISTLELPPRRETLGTKSLGFPAGSASPCSGLLITVSDAFRVMTQTSHPSPGMAR
ncbi:hypothetical protein E2C01_098132 [Portunus trituberculatus]|uniref:Uncharacterized protein n=1 Tax=Portunus trituberculatus TaxID=210409 RepID=A0A5B7K275_PORTR|nr:hypothetical protein [Portunus trituberculatus]